jgi:hypothetical protein
MAAPAPRKSPSRREQAPVFGELEYENPKQHPPRREPIEVVVESRLPTFMARIMGAYRHWRDSRAEMAARRSLATTTAEAERCDALANAFDHRWAQIEEVSARKVADAAAHAEALREQAERLGVAHQELSKSSGRIAAARQAIRAVIQRSNGMLRRFMQDEASGPGESDIEVQVLRQSQELDAQLGDAQIRVRAAMAELDRATEGRGGILTAANAVSAQSRNWQEAMAAVQRLVERGGSLEMPVPPPFTPPADWDQRLSEVGDEIAQIRASFAAQQPAVRKTEVASVEEGEYEEAPPLPPRPSRLALPKIKPVKWEPVDREHPEEQPAPSSSARGKHVVASASASPEAAPAAQPAPQEKPFAEMSEAELSERRRSAIQFLEWWNAFLMKGPRAERGSELKPRHGRLETFPGIDDRQKLLEWMTTQTLANRDFWKPRDWKGEEDGWVKEAIPKLRDSMTRQLDAFFGKRKESTAPAVETPSPVAWPEPVAPVASLPEVSAPVVAEAAVPTVPESVVAPEAISKPLRKLLVDTRETVRHSALQDAVGGAFVRAESAVQTLASEGIGTEAQQRAWAKVVADGRAQLDRLDHVSRDAEFARTIHDAAAVHEAIVDGAAALSTMVYQLTGVVDDAEAATERLFVQKPYRTRRSSIDLSLGLLRNGAVQLTGFVKRLDRLAERFVDELPTPEYVPEHVTPHVDRLAAVDKKFQDRVQRLEAHLGTVLEVATGLVNDLGRHAPPRVRSFVQDFAASARRYHDVTASELEEVRSLMQDGSAESEAALKFDGAYARTSSFFHDIPGDFRVMHQWVAESDPEAAPIIEAAANKLSSVWKAILG